MNAFEYLKEMADVITAKKDAVSDKTLTISMEEHYKEMLNMIQILSMEMETAEYHYNVEALEQTVHTFDEFTVLQKQLNDELVLIQPLALGEEELSMLDMQSLCDILQQVRDSGLIKENIIILPPNVNIFKAKLAKPKEDEN